MDNEIKNVFISHVHEDDAGLAGLKALVEKGGLATAGVRDWAGEPRTAAARTDPWTINRMSRAPRRSS